MRIGFLARALVVLSLALVPLRIVAQGFLPDDDVLRHAAKAVSGRAWSEVLVLRPEVTMDSHPGWHGLLSLVHQATGADAHALEHVLERGVDPAPWRRVALAAGAGVAALLVLSANARASRGVPPERSFLSLTAKAADPYLPDPGGVLYTDDMRLFFQLFYARPTDPWRYVVGYEPALMPALWSGRVPRPPAP